jgi:beta-carotene hydroxylase
LPLALASVFAVAILVHDLIHNALRLRRPWSDLVLSFSALFLIKSGHALRASHVQHHRLCLSTDDEEGRVAHDSILRLVLTGPYLALRARWTAMRDGSNSRAWQVAETTVNVASFAALAAAARLGSRGALLYLGAVLMVTVSAPIWGAKIPHTLPVGHPIVVWLRERANRWTPAACSVLFHELHHRAPRIPVALLAERRTALEGLPPSPCEEPHAK